MRYYDPIVGQDPPSQSEPASAYMKDDPYGKSFANTQKTIQLSNPEDLDICDLDNS